MSELAAPNLGAENSSLPDRLPGVAPDVYRLFFDISQICEEVGCICLAKRFRGAANVYQDEALPRCSGPAFQRHPTLHLLVKLAPLTSALVTAGYYDLALMTTELALTLEPTLDLDISRAYLLVILGERDEAWRVYNTVLIRHGSLPVEEIRRLAELASCHPGEEDIAELYSMLKTYARESNMECNLPKVGTLLASLHLPPAGAE